MVKIEIMSPESFETFKKYSCENYARTNVEAGRWEAEGSVQRAKENLEGMLPQGMDTKDNWFFDIREEKSSNTVGFIYFSIATRNGVRAGYIYDFEIYDKFRRSGFASAALKELEHFVIPFDIPHIELHVFGSNTAARLLYEKSGFEIEGITMRRTLDR